VNSAKTQALSVGPCAYYYSLFLSNARKVFLLSIKILGVTLDKDLSCQEHISDQLKKAYAKASALRRIRRFLPRNATINLYEAFILPYLELILKSFVCRHRYGSKQPSRRWQLLYFENIKSGTTSQCHISSCSLL